MENIKTDGNKEKVQHTNGKKGRLQGNLVVSCLMRAIQMKMVTMEVLVKKKTQVTCSFQIGGFSFSMVVYKGGILYWLINRLIYVTRAEISINAQQPTPPWHTRTLRKTGR